MEPCKALLPEGQPCSNKVDEGQDYCPYHLANQDAKVKKGILKFAGTVVAGVLALAARGLASSENK